MPTFSASWPSQLKIATEWHRADQGGISDQECLPESLAGARYFESTGNGYEKTISERLDAWEQELKTREARLQKKEGELESYVARAQGELGKREAALRVVSS